MRRALWWLGPIGMAGALLSLAGCGESGVIEDVCGKYGMEYRVSPDGRGYCYKEGDAVDEATCAELDLEYGETADGRGFCYLSTVDCSLAPEGTPCDDGDACTVHDACTSGVCIGSGLPDLDDGNPCTRDGCDPISGEVTHDPAPMDGSACDDGDVCSTGEQCQGGLCRGVYTTDSDGLPIDDGDACTRDFCDEGGHRQNVPYTPEEAAVRGLGDISFEDVANPCLQYECVVGAGQTPHMNVLDGVDCSDPDAGRTNGACVLWTCNDGTCAAQVDEAAVAEAEIEGSATHPACRMRRCNTSTGQVEYTADPRKVGSACNDDNPCTFADVCREDGSCNGRQTAHGTSCDDDDPCTRGDICHEGACMAGEDLLARTNQEDPEGILGLESSCLQYVCDPARGVVVAAVADGTSCDDGNQCTAASACQGGECVGVRDSANDGRQCTHPFNPCELGECDKGVCINYQPVQDGRSCTGSAPCKVYHCDIVDDRGVCLDDGNLPDGSACGQANRGCLDLVCDAGVCIEDPDRANHQDEPCGEYDSRCNDARCDAQGFCQPNGFDDLRPCQLTAEDLQAVGMTANDLPCNQGSCRVFEGVGVCTPSEDNMEASCDNGNPCDGADWCEAFSGLGRCVERHRTDDPEDPDFDNLVPTGNDAFACEVDGDLRTVGRCKYTGECVEISRVIDDVNDCTRPVFDEETGAVAYQEVPDGTRCHLIEINPCVENHGVCIQGECHVNLMPDGTGCDLAGQAVPADADLPDGHRPECYAEVCIAGVCVVDTSLQNGQWCNDSETVCTAAGTCQDGLCVESDLARGYGETCVPAGDNSIVDMAGNPIAPRDVACWSTFECSEGGTCSVAVARLPDDAPCDFDLDGDTCDGWCQEGACLAHTWAAGPGASCDDGEVCTTDGCDGSGDCAHEPLEGPRVGCSGVDPANSCADLECRSGVCTSFSDDTNICDDGNLCTYPDRCEAGVCIGTADAARNGWACGGIDDQDTDPDCVRAECQDGTCVLSAGLEDSGTACGDGNPCVLAGHCDGQGGCILGDNLPDGTNCDTNGVPCDEGCVDVDGPDGDAASACLPFESHVGLLDAGEMAANSDPEAAAGWEELACRQKFDPTFDPADPDTGHSCARYVCYFGGCHPWDAELPADAGLGPNPENGRACGDAGECTRRGVCEDNVCLSYHHLPDETPCGQARCGEDDDRIFQPSCHAGACTAEGVLIDACSKGIATCQANDCYGGGCPYTCVPESFDYVNAFEDISASGTARRDELRSPLNTGVTCGDFTTGAATEEERMACDDGSILLDLQADLGFVSPDGDGEGFWFYNRRFRYISISANGTVLFHKDHPAALSEEEHTLFVAGNVGGAAFDPDAGDQPGDPVNDGTNAAQMRVFCDDLTFISDITEDPPQSPTVRYGAFAKLGEIYTRHMPGPDGAAGNADDYLIAQWDRAAFYGCAPGTTMRSTMTFQLKWWPVTGLVLFAYPPDVSDDGLGTAPGCLPGRVLGADASIGLFDENGVPADEVGTNAMLLVHDAGPGTDSFDDYFMFWPLDRPVTGYAWRAHAWFEDLTVYDPSLGDTRGAELGEPGNCDTCCQRVEFERPFFIDGIPRSVMNVCADGYVHFQDIAQGDDHSLDNGGSTMLDADELALFVAPFWSDLRMAAGSGSRVHWLDDESTGRRRIIVQWTRADYDYRIIPEGLPADAQERGEVMCSDNVDNDEGGQGAVDCDDESCSCAVACGGEGCGLTFQVILHDGLGFVEFRYLSPEEEFVHAVHSSSGAAIGAERRGAVPRGIDLLDGRNGGDPTHDDLILLDPADRDEQLPGTQRSIVLYQIGHLTPYDLEDLSQP